MTLFKLSVYTLYTVHTYITGTLEHNPQNNLAGQHILPWIQYRIYSTFGTIWNQIGVPGKLHWGTLKSRNWEEIKPPNGGTTFMFEKARINPRQLNPDG